MAKEIIEENGEDIWQKLDNPSMSLGAKIGIWTLPLVGASCALAFGIVGVYGVISCPFAFFDRIGIGMVNLGTGILSLGLMILFALSTLWLSKKIVKITWEFTKFIVGCFRRRRRSI